VLAEIALQIALLVAETLIIGSLLLFLFRLRGRFGLALLYVTLGGFQHLQTSLAGNIALEFAPGIAISPGSAIMFSTTLFAILLVYLREDVAETRSVVYGIVLANLVIGAIIAMFSLHLNSALITVNPNFNPATLFVSMRMFFAGTAVLILDVLLLIVAFEFFCRLFKTPYWQVFCTLATVFIFDTVLFVFAAFFPHDNLVQMMISSILGKLMAALILPWLLIGYLRFFPRLDDKLGVGDHSPDSLATQVQGIFGALTYRQRYDALRERFHRDAMTNLYNRGFFDSNLQPEIDRAERLNHPVSLLLADIDHFKNINDTHGHLVGDRVIRILADCIGESFRNSDIACRFGGEEFAIIMPDTGKEAATMLANRLRSAFDKAITHAELPSPVEPVNMTIGISTFPIDAGDGFALLEIVDQRLYAGKRGGRNRVVASQTHTKDS